VNNKPGDLISGYNGMTLQDAINSEAYRTPSNIVGGSFPRDAAKFIYVIDEDGTIWVTRNLGSLHHPDLVSGSNVYGAGEMYINQVGEIIYIDDYSGHYLPHGDQFFPYMRYLLSQLGLNVLDNVFRVFRPAP